MSVYHIFTNEILVFKPLKLRRALKKLQNFENMSKLGLPYVPCTLIWTKESLDKYSSVYPTYLPKKFGHFGIKVCSISNFPHFFRNSIKHNFS